MKIASLHRLFQCFLICGVISCIKSPEYPIEPKIEYAGISKMQNNGKDSLLFIKISFTDGDGDIGSPENVTDSNLIVVPFRKNVVPPWDTVRDGTILNKAVIFHNKIKNISVDSKNPALRGEIAIKITLSPFALKDTYRFNVFMFDRAKHQSNTVTTPDIFWDP